MESRFVRGSDSQISKRHMQRMPSTIRVSRSYMMVLSLIALASMLWIFGTYFASGNVEMYDNKKDIRTPAGQILKEKLTFDGSLTFDAKEEMKKLNEEKVSQDDPRLIKIIRDYYILPPNGKPYNLQNPNQKDYSGQNKTFLVPNTVKDLPEKGFFIECGANDGEFLSSTLYFEKEKHWNGLLIEANPHLFKQLKKKNRQAYALNACLSTHPYPSIMQFNLNGAISRLVEGSFDDAYKHHSTRWFKKIKNIVSIQCFPLYSVLLAMDQTRVDFFGLDVEGAEKAILETVPMDKTDIRVMLVEYSHQDSGVKPMQDYLESNGYKTLKIVKEDILVQKM